MAIKTNVIAAAGYYRTHNGYHYVQVAFWTDDYQVKTVQFSAMENRDCVESMARTIFDDLTIWDT